MTHTAPATFTHPADPPSPPTSKWTPAVIERLTELHKTGSASVVATQLQFEFNIPFTRNAVVGKLHRLGLTVNDKTQVHPLTNHTKRRSRPKLKVINSGFGATIIESIEREMAPLRIVPLPPLNLTLANLPESGCRYIAGDDLLYCGHPRSERSSYCSGHHQLVWTKPDKRWV